MLKSSNSKIKKTTFVKISGAFRTSMIREEDFPGYFWGREPTIPDVSRTWPDTTGGALCGRTRNYESAWNLNREQSKQSLKKTC